MKALEIKDEVQLEVKDASMCEVLIEVVGFDETNTVEYMMGERKIMVTDIIKR